MNCEFCTQTFNTRSTLFRHQRTAKYCLSVQKNKNTCVCGYNENNIEYHKEKCFHNKHEILKIKNIGLENTNENLKDQIVQLRQQITILQDKLENIAIQGVKKSSIVTNTNTNNNIVLQPLTSEWLNTQASLLSRSDIEKGLVGYAEFAKNYSFKDRIKCSDFSRKKLEFIEEDGTLIKDNKGNRVAKLFFQSIQTQNQEIITKIQDDILKQVSETSSQSETMYLLEKMTDLVNISRGVKKVSQGESDIIKDDFIRELCNVLEK